MSQNLNLTVKSAIARLLATENIQVNQTNSKTAWFDVERRILNLPLWDVEPYVYDMLVGHEVGHALYTPAQGWHDAQIDLGIPRSYINVVEDARIEKLIKNKYPGLVLTFTRAYGWMADQDFFKIGHRKLNTLRLIDRINLHFKLGSSIKVPFADSEMVFVDRVARAETFDEVVEISKDILEFWKANKRDVQEQLEDMIDSLGDIMSGDVEDDDYDYDYDMSDAGDNDEDADEDGTATTADVSDKEDTNTDDDQQVKVKGAGTTKDPAAEEPEEDPEVAETDDALRISEKSMLSTEKGGILKYFPEAMAIDAMVPYKKYYAAPRTLTLRRAPRMGFNRWDHVDPLAAYANICDEQFKKFMIETNRAVAYMAKEFEQKKAAYQYSRAKVSTSGTLNTTALHKYKFSEDVFKRITTLANAKSHGMIISIDMSGSMSDVLMDTLKQALNLALFCRRVNIPFDMYGFTCGRDDVDFREMESRLMDGMVFPGSFRYIQFFSHKMKKSEFDKAVRSVFMMGCGDESDYDYLGSTPTNEMLMTLTYLLKRFRKETGVQKMMNIVLTDGEPNRSSIQSGVGGYNNHNLLQLSPTKIVKVYNTGADLSRALLEHIAKECDVTNIGYFLGDAGALKNTMYRITRGSYSEVQSIKNDMRKSGGASVDNVMGYDRYVLVRGSSFNIEDGEFEVAEDAKKSTIAKEFAKYTKGKRTSRILLDRFVQAVA